MPTIAFTNPDIYLFVGWKLSLDEEKSFYKRSGLFSVSMSERAFSALPHDQWIEMIMNKDSKTKGGWIAITHNEEGLQVSNQVIDNITKVKESLKKIANTKKCKYSQIKCSPARATKDAKTVEILIGTLQE